MGKNIKIKKGLDIKLEGSADQVLKQADFSETVIVQPHQFFGIKPKVLVQEGNEVKAGTPLFFDKNNPEVMITSPVSGEVVEVKRGAKRVLEYIKILADKEQKYESFKSGNTNDFSKEEIKDILCKSGAWNLIRQRPYTNVARTTKTPKALFISSFDSAPLAPDNDFAIHGMEKEFEAGLAILNKLMDGKVHMTNHVEKTKSRVYTDAKGVNLHSISGPHPSGNISVQVHHIDPINKGELIWHTSPQDVAIIGKLFTQGKLDMTRVVAITGAGFKKHHYVKTILGSSIKSIVGSDNIVEGEYRIVSGNVLTGENVGADGYLGYYDTQVTAVPEGHHQELFGWITPGFKKFSMSKSFFSWLTPGKQYNLDTNLHGEKRAFVVTNEYDKVFPMDIYPQYLLKAIITNDIDKQEALGIYEVAPEDFALCEFVCTSKIESQAIIEKGLADLYNDEIESEKSHH